MSAKEQQRNLAEYYADVCKEIFAKETLTEYDRVEIETLCAIAIEMIKNASPSVVRESARTVELRSYKGRINGIK